jgi:hypothetical protein
VRYYKTASDAVLFMKKILKGTCYNSQTYFEQTKNVKETSQTLLSNWSLLVQPSYCWERGGLVRNLNLGSVLYFFSHNTHSTRDGCESIGVKFYHGLCVLCSKRQCGLEIAACQLSLELEQLCRRLYCCYPF